MDELIRNVNKGRVDRMGNKEVKLLCYADSAICIVIDEDNLQRLFQIFNIKVKEFSMAVSSQKTKTTVISKEPIKCKIEIDGISFEQLETIDQDLKASRNVVEHVQNLSSSSDIITNNLEITTFRPTLSTEKHNVTSKYNGTLKIKKKVEEELPWPNFDESDNNVKFVNSSYTKLNETQSQNLVEKAKNKTSKSAYPKNFTYHRVTGKPDSTSKNPKAYIAVSIIAPKTAPEDTNSKQSDEVTLENELHQLKPWSHVQNLKNMESIRSKWHAKKNQKKRNS
uniref:Uncharacterized protein LOC114333350 n=1 Tax=Diabrotica virgifera virgifera TaxID=50390 RepID=A0A6P7FRV5_DIAVI